MEESNKDEKTLNNTPTPGNFEFDEVDSKKNHKSDLTTDMESLNVTEMKMGIGLEKENTGSDQEHKVDVQVEGSYEIKLESRELDSQDLKETDQVTEEILAEEKEADPVFDGTEMPEQATQDMSSQSPDIQSEEHANAWPDKAAALKNYVKEKGAVAVTVLRRLSGKKDEVGSPREEEKIDGVTTTENEHETTIAEDNAKESPEKYAERSTWNPLKFMKIGRDVGSPVNPDPIDQANADSSTEDLSMRGRIILFTRLGCKDSKLVRSMLHKKGLKYVEINIDIFPGRKMELEKRAGSSVVPRLYFNDFLGEEKIKDLFNEEPSDVAPLPPLPGEDDESGSGKVDELASVVRKMKESVIPKDRFFRMRRFSNSFLGSQVVDFLEEDQYLEREEAVEFARKLAGQHFFRHVSDENEFEDGNHLYRFLEHDPIVMSQCYNIPKGILDVQPKPITEIALRLRLMSYAIFEAYVSEDGKHVDYISISASEEFKRYLRTIEELQRVDMSGLSREEKLAFFLNLHNMMAIHAILTWGYPVRALDRSKFLGDFKYVIGGCTYSLSAILNGILRGNQRPPYNLIKPFGPKDRRSKVALPYVEPLVHFALVSGNKSGPALKCYSPGNIDKELMDAARDFMRNGGLIVDAETKTAFVNKILKWYSTDFGKNEVEVLKHAANYLETAKSEELLELLATTQLKVVYQPYDWAQNC